MQQRCDGRGSMCEFEQSTCLDDAAAAAAAAAAVRSEIAREIVSSFRLCSE